MQLAEKLGADALKSVTWSRQLRQNDNIEQWLWDRYTSHKPRKGSSGSLSSLYKASQAASTSRAASRYANSNTSSPKYPDGKGSSRPARSYMSKCIRDTLITTDPRTGLRKFTTETLTQSQICVREAEDWQKYHERINAMSASELAALRALQAANPPSSTPRFSG